MRFSALALACVSWVSLAACATSGAKNKEEKSLTARIEVGRQFLASGEYTKAVQFLQPLTREAPENTDLHMLLGLSFLGLENHDAAAAAFQRTMELDKKNDDAKLNYGYALILKKRHKDARKVLEGVLADGRYLYMERVHVNIGLSHMEENRCDLAEPRFAEALKLDPTFVTAYFNSGKCAMKRKQYSAAIGQFKRASDFCPGCIDPILELSRARYLAGQKAAAVDELERVLRGRVDRAGADRAKALLRQIKR